jgi:DNA polymerase-3 subunit gamma/tau
MAITLYRKYRPQTFSEVVGQNHVKVTLQNEIKQGKVTQAYLFSGPRGIGKTSVARILAKSVNCQKRKGGESEPCNKCAACEEITIGNSLDVLEIDAASHTGVDNVRENIIESARFTPNKLQYKVFIIDEVHMLSLSAFNALLKILEEPPAHVIFILCTTEIHRIPATIISRCQRFDFRKVGFNDMVDHLSHICKKEGVSCDKEVLQSVARHSEGYLRDAVGLIGQILSLGEKKIGLEQAQLAIPRSNFLLVFEFVEYLVKRDTEKALKLINRLVEEGINLNQFTLDLIEFLRKLLLNKISGSLEEFTLELDTEGEKNAAKLLDKLELEKIVKMIDIFIEKNQALKNSSITQLPLELAVIEICGEISGRSGENPRSEIQNPKSETEISSLKLNSKNDKSIVKSEIRKGEKGAVAIEVIEQKWNELISSLNHNNHSLALMLRVGKPLAVVGAAVRIGFKYKFHQEMIAENKNRLTLAEALSKIMGAKLEVEPVVAEDIEIKVNRSDDVKNDDSITEVAEMFGGKVVS